MVDIAIALNIDQDVRKSYRVDNNTSIVQAVYEMLYCWYKTQDGLGKNSKGLQRLSDTLVAVDKPNLMTTVINKHFEDCIDVST